MQKEEQKMNPQKVKKKISIIVLFFIMFSIIPVKSFAAQMPIDPWDYTWLNGISMLLVQARRIKKNCGQLVQRRKSK